MIMIPLKRHKTAAKKPRLKKPKANVRVVPAQVYRFHRTVSEFVSASNRAQARIDSRRRKLLLSNSVESSILNRRWPFGTSVTDC